MAGKPGMGVDPLSPALQLYLKAFDVHLRTGSQTSRDVMTAALYGHAGRALQREGRPLGGDDALENVLDGRTRAAVAN